MRIRVLGKKTDGNKLKAVVIDTENKVYGTESTYTIGNIGHVDLVIHATSNKEVTSVIEQLDSSGFRVGARY